MYIYVGGKGRILGGGSWEIDEKHFETPAHITILTQVLHELHDILARGLEQCPNHDRLSLCGVIPAQYR